MLKNAERKHERLMNKVSDTMSVRTYNLVLGGLLLYGFVMNALFVSVVDDFFMHVSPIAFLIGYFISCFVGCFMAIGSNNPIVSFIGYNLVVLPIGALMSLALSAYNLGDIFAAMIVTGVVVGIMIIWAVINPTFFSGMGRTLFFSLVVGLISEIVATLMGYGGDIFNWFFVIIFSLYIGYDWCKAQAYSKTLDNAIDSALDIYLDIINLFLRILEIMAKKDD